MSNRKGHSGKYKGRYCKQFLCDTVGQYRCCADCWRNEKHLCEDACKNSPEMCGLEGVRNELEVKIMAKSNIILLKKGDKCPCCGNPIPTDDPYRLAILSAFRAILESQEGARE